MTDLLHILPDFQTQRFSHLLPSLDKHLLTTTDILSLDAVDVAKRARVPVAEVRKFADAILAELHGQLGLTPAEAGDSPAPTGGWRQKEWQTVSTLDDRIDAELGGGIPTGYVTEMTGESGAGKTQFLLTLLLSVQLPPPHGLSKSALYISTEAALSTPRLSQLLSTHPKLTSNSTSSSTASPSLARILSIQTPDLESQDHILRYQLPVAITKHNVGLVVIDSVAANYRAEFDHNRPESGNPGPAAAMARRSAQLVQLGALLRATARDHNIAIVVANQVADRFAPPPPSASGLSRHSSINTQRSADISSTAGTTAAAATAALTPQQSSLLVSPDALTLDHQQRWFTGWGDDAHMSERAPQSLKTPSLGLVWANQIGCRIALVKRPVWGGVRSVRPKSVLDAVFGTGEEDDDGEESRQTEVRRWRRWMRVVWAAWAAPSLGPGVEFRIEGRGIVAKDSEELEAEVEAKAEGEEKVKKVEVDTEVEAK